MSRSDTTQAVDRFLAPRCERNERANTTIADLSVDFNRWAADTGQPPVTAKALTMALRERGVSTGRNRNARYYVGIGVTHSLSTTSPLSEYEGMPLPRSSRHQR